MPTADHDAWRLSWDDTRLVHAWLRLPGSDAIELRPRTTDHLLLGPCDAVHREGERESIARIAAVSWHAPECIPAVDVPGALPQGAGTAILNLLATLAKGAGIRSLRYRGPYPTSALFATLAASFAIAGDRDDAEARFVDHPGFGMHDAVPDVDFVPEPHTWSWPTPRVCLQRRDAIERVWIDARAYDRDGPHHALVRDGDGWSARLVLAGNPWCEVLRLDDRGTPCAAIASPPPAPAELVGIALPRAMIDVLADVIVAESATPLGSAIRAVLAAGITLADTGLAVARADPGGIVVHAALAERALGKDGATSLALLAQALRPVVVRAAIQEVVGFVNDSNAGAVMSR